MMGCKWHKTANDAGRPPIDYGGSRITDHGRCWGENETSLQRPDREQGGPREKSSKSSPEISRSNPKFSMGC